jgi:D-lactate dehydrogenase
MAKICIYHASDQDREDFAVLSKDHEVKFFDGILTAENVEADAEIISIFVGCAADESLIKLMPELKFIACRSTGYNNVDLSATKKNNIFVSNVPTYGEHTVAEYTIGLMLALSRKLLDAVEQARVGEINANLVHGHDLNGKTLGVIGLGKIGLNVARLSKAFGMKIIAYDPFPDEKNAKDIGLVFVPLEKLLTTADIVSLHAPLTSDNRHMIGKEELASMKRGTKLINTSRGELVDTLALVDALQTGHLAGAAIDVIEDESLMDVDEEEMLLRKGRAPKRTLENAMAIDVLVKMMHNVIITSHNAYNTLEALQRINNTTVENIRAYLSGKPQNVVTK